MPASKLSVWKWMSARTYGQPFLLKSPAATLMIWMRPSLKKLAIEMAKAEDRSLSSFISRLIVAAAGYTDNAMKKRGQR